MNTEKNNQTNVKFCTKCGTKAIEGDLFCAKCGAELRKRTEETNSVVVTQRAIQHNQPMPETAIVTQNHNESDRVVFGIMCIIFNSIGVPCFMRGRVSDGILRIILMCVTFGVVGVINGIKGIIWGIRILNMGEEEYQAKKNLFGRGIFGI
ncbi:MAG: zinc-ribbon domain-containing protein [Ruminococcaceae bacterium]|nr:zinc-ribbon domain-containing protein [Oscillospiraceae bacterium]